MSDDVAIWKVTQISGNTSVLETKFVLDNGTYSTPGSSLEILGWGTTKIGGGGSLSNILLQASVPGISLKS